MERSYLHRPRQFVSGKWDNRGMRLKLASVFVVIGLLGSSLTPANAIFGLSKCEKVKKQILAYEKIEKPLVKDWQNYAGDWIFSYSIESQLRIQQRWVNLVNLEVKIYALEINNPKCFTNSQKIYIKNVYPIWKKYQSINKFTPTANNANNGNGYYTSVNWDSIYNQ
jgi:hypothetical protein